MARAQQLLFRIFYSTSYTFVFVILFAFICASPVDTLYQSYRRRRLIDIAFIAGTYIVTGLFALLIYASRLYTNRSVISAIPKTYMPIDEDELPSKRTWQFVSNILVKSAVIAFQAKPRSQRIELEIPEAKERMIAALQPEYSKGPKIIDVEPQWGKIEHRGWSSPAKDNLANLEYAVVIAELLDLIEAKAVSLATLVQEDTSTLDSRVVEVLTRPENAGMRQYLTLLMDVGVIPSTPLAAAFLSHYEQARFAPQPLSEDEFQTLMRMFAELLRSMQPLDASILALDDAFVGEDTDKNDAISTIRDHTNYMGLVSKRSSVSDRGSVHQLMRPPARVSEDSVPSQATDESSRDVENNSFDMTQTPARSHANVRQISRSNGNTDSRMVDLSTARRPSLRQRSSHASGLSIHSTRSGKSSKSGKSMLSTSGSVIVRLSDANNDAANTDSLPYTIEFSSVATQGAESRQ